MRCFPPARSDRSWPAAPWSCGAITTGPAETAETIDAEGWLHTGDLGYLTPEGRLVVAGGRLRDMIIRGGENIYPAEIENLLRAHDAIAEIAVFGLPDSYYGEVVGAAVKAKRPGNGRSFGGAVPGPHRPLQDPQPLLPGGELPHDGERQDPQGRAARAGGGRRAGTLAVRGPLP